MSKAVTRPASGNQPGQWGINMVFAGIRPGGLIFMWDWGGKLFDDDTNPRTLSLDPAGVAGWQWMADLFSKHRVVPTADAATAGGFTNTSQMVTAGHVAFNFSSLTWRGYRNNTGFKADVQLLPKGPARQTAGHLGGRLTMPSVAKSPTRAGPDDARLGSGGAEADGPGGRPVPLRGEHRHQLGVAQVRPV